MRLYSKCFVAAAALLTLLPIKALAQERQRVLGDDIANIQPSQALSGAAGATLGGVLGNQVGAGQGRTLATAAGAVAGAMIASGCKVGIGTGLGALAGGLLGAQVGNGNGSRAMAGVGAAVGALLGSDCSPVANAAEPAPIQEMPPVVFNGMTLVPVTGFPLEAFRGLPPIVTLEDINTALVMSQVFTGRAHYYRNQSDFDNAALNAYWAKRTADTVLSVISASLETIRSGRKGEVTIAPGALVILPGFLPGRDSTSLPRYGFLQEDRPGQRWVDGIKVADRNSFPAAPVERPRPSGQPTQMITLPDSLKAIPERIPLKLASGALILRTPDGLTVYNPNATPTAVPLSDLDFVPRTPPPSALRKEAAPLAKQIHRTAREWLFYRYIPTLATKENTQRPLARVEVPNLLVDANQGEKPIGYLTETGEVAERPASSGEKAFASNPVYREAVTLLSAIGKAPPTRQFFGRCMSIKKSGHGILEGEHASIYRAICFDGTYPSYQQILTKTYYIGEDLSVVMSTESMLEDVRIRQTMTQAMADGEQISNLLSFAALAGNIESGLQCVGTNTVSQYSSVMGQLGSAGFEKATLADWVPPPPAEWGLDRVMNCLGAIPLAGTGVKLIQKGGPVMLQSNLATLQRAIEAFESPRTFQQLFSGARKVEALFPGNPTAAGFIKAMYDGMMAGQNYAQTMQAVGYFGGIPGASDRVTSIHN